MCCEHLREPDTFHIPFLPSRQASSSQPLQLEVVGEQSPAKVDKSTKKVRCVHVL